MPIYMALRAALGITILSASLVGLYNFMMTVVAGESYEPEYIVNPEVGVL